VRLLSFSTIKVIVLGLTRVLLLLFHVGAKTRATSPSSPVEHNVHTHMRDGQVRFNTGEEAWSEVYYTGGVALTRATSAPLPEA